MMALSTVHSSDVSDTAAHDGTEYCTAAKLALLRLMMALSAVHSSDVSDTAAHDGTEYCTQQ